MRVGIIGASGYAGAELMRLVLGHSHLELTYVTAAKHEGESVASLYRNFVGHSELIFQIFRAEEALEKTDLLFVALPHGRSMDIVPGLLQDSNRVIDLGGDFRLGDPQMYQDWYGFSHLNPDYLEQAIYGLPEINGDSVREAGLVANPGCYPTSAILGLAPLLQGDFVEPGTIVVDSKSGVSGAGRGLLPHLHFSAANENLAPYAVVGHKHVPEMEEQLSRLAGTAVRLSFVPHLVPMTRGILSTVYASLSRELSSREALELFRGYYAQAPFVKILEEGLLPGTKDVRASNYCHIGLSVDTRNRRIIILAALDNLVKGAAGQAIQNLNLMAGYDEREGLVDIPAYP